MKDPTVDRLEQLLFKYGNDQDRGIRDILHQFQITGVGYYPDAGWSKVDDLLPIKVAYGTAIYQFRVDQVPFLNDLLEKFETEVAKPKQNVYVSKEAENILNKRHEEEDGFLKQAKLSANKVIHTGSPHDIILGMRTYLELAGGPPMTVAAANGYLFIYLQTEDEIVEKITSIEVPKKRAAPEKVAVKMILLRIRKINDLVHQTNKHIQEELKNQVTAGQVANNKDYYTPIPILPVDGGRESIIEYINTVLANRNRTQYQSKQLRKETLKLLKREDMTDAVVDEALKIAQVAEVMDS